MSRFLWTVSGHDLIYNPPCLPKMDASVSVVAMTTRHLMNGGGKRCGLLIVWHSGESHSGLLILRGIDGMSISRIIFATEPPWKVNLFPHSGRFKHRITYLHLSQCMCVFGPTMMKCLRFEAVCFVCLSFAHFVYFVQIHRTINFTNKMKPAQGTRARWQTVELHAKHDVTYRRQHGVTHRTSNETQDKCQFEY